MLFLVLFGHTLLNFSSNKNIKTLQKVYQSPHKEKFHYNHLTWPGVSRTWMMDQAIVSNWSIYSLIDDEKLLKMGKFRGFLQRGGND